MLVLVTPWVPLRYCCGSNVGFKVMLAAKGTNHKQKATPQGVLRHSQSQKQTNLHQRVVRGAAYYLLMQLVKLLRL